MIYLEGTITLVLLPLLSIGGLLALLNAIPYEGPCARDEIEERLLKKEGLL